jgi:pSer/pThr/pTyr-binding forkhead associated (FHA) protein
MPHTEVPVLADGFTIGRGGGNDLNIPDPSVSRQHARLRYAQGAWFIQDQGSTGGILVNDVPVFASRLNSGDRVSIGKTSIIFWSP